MKIENIQQILKNTFKIAKHAQDVWVISTPACFIDGKPINLLLENRDNKWYLTDGKCTFKYMNDLYELKSSDVKMCIKSVLKIYNFSISQGLIMTEIPDIKTFYDKLFDMIMCIGQLANMFAFFDKPQ